MQHVSSVKRRKLAACVPRLVDEQRLTMSTNDKMRERVARGCALLEQQLPLERNANKPLILRAWELWQLSEGDAGKMLLPFNRALADFCFARACDLVSEDTEELSAWLDGEGGEQIADILDAEVRRKGAEVEHQLCGLFGKLSALNRGAMDFRNECEAKLQKATTHSVHEVSRRLLERAQMMVEMTMDGERLRRLLASTQIPYGEHRTSLPHPLLMGESEESRANIHADDLLRLSKAGGRDSELAQTWLGGDSKDNRKSVREMLTRAKRRAEKI